VSGYLNDARASAARMDIAKRTTVNPENAGDARVRVERGVTLVRDHLKVHVQPVKKRLKPNQKGGFVDQLGTLELVDAREEENERPLRVPRT